MLFDDEKNKLSIMINQKNVFENIHYRIKNDENIKKIFRNLKYYIDNYDNMEWAEGYYFNKNLEETCDFLNMFISYATREGFFKDKSAEEIMEPCSVLSDSNGISFIKIVGYSSILNILNKKRIYLKYKSNLLNDNDLKHLSKFEEERLQNPYRMNTIRNPEDLKNYHLMNEFYSKKIKDYEENEMSDDNFLLKSISEILTEKEGNDVQNNILEIGKKYWNEKLEQKKSEIEKFSEIFKALADNLENKKES